MLEALERGVKGGVWFSLIDKVYRLRTLECAWRQVKAKGGSAGSDRQSITDFERRLTENLTRIREELRGGRYRPRPIRRVYIDKPGSHEKRPLGIPAVRDRVVQAALRLVIEPIFEREFIPSSYGFRPGRGCKDALREVDRLLKAGYHFVVDADLRKYFDTIPHDRLMDEVRTRIADRKVLGLIEQFLTQDVLEGMVRWVPEQGTPQGAVISPLLANLYLHSMDVQMAAEGYRMIRYADDIVVLCSDRTEAEAAWARLQALGTDKGLEFHPEKSRLVDATEPGQGFDFLGYHFEAGTRWPRKKSLKKLKDAVRAKTRRSNGQSLERIIRELNRTTRGWFEYYKHSRRWTFPPLDGWIRRRLRSILRQRLRRKGISRGFDNMRWPNAFFREYGLFCLEDAYRTLLQSSCR